MELNDYEKQVISEIEKWERKEPSVVTQALNAAAKPLVAVINFILPEKAILGALTTFNDLASFFTDEGDILRDGNVSTIEELRKKDLYLSDKLSSNVAAWARGIAIAEGGSTGMAGLFGMAVDVPTLVTLALRTIQKIALCYGYKCNTEAEKMMVFQIMSSASANSVQEKTATLATLKQIETAIRTHTWKVLAEQAANKQGIPAFIMCIKNLAKQLGINITKRKALQTIPIVSAGIGAVMNAAYITDITEAAIRIYEKRWLNDNGKYKTDI